MLPHSTYLAAILSLLPAMSQAAGDVLRIALPAAAVAPDSLVARIYTEDGIAHALARDLAKATGQTLDPAAPDQPDAALRLSLSGDTGSGNTGGVPTGYQSGLTVAMRTDTDIANWTDIAGRKICFTDTNTQARDLIADFGGIPVAERAPAFSLMKVRNGECDAGLHEAALLHQLFQRPEWQKFSASLPVQRQATLVLSVADPASLPQVQAALAPITTDQAWQRRSARWARNVAFEVWMEQDAPDCH